MPYPIDYWSDLSGIQLRYRNHVHGPTTLVLSHELGGALESWDELIKELGERYSTLRYDQRGHGFSEKVRERPSLKEHVSDLDAILASASPRGPLYFVGSAAGCQVGIAYERHRPGSFAGMVLCCPALSSSPAQAAYLAERAKLVRAQGMRAVVDISLARSYPESYRTRTPYRTYRRRMLANDPWCYANANESVGLHDLQTELSCITCPVLVLAGKDDAVRPPNHVRDIASEFQQWQFDLLDSGHLMAVQAPRVLARAIIDFVDVNALSAPRKGAASA